MTAMTYLVKGSELLAARPDFKLVGRDADLARLTAVLLRNKSSSIILAGPGGVGCSALCMGLQASKDNPDAPFDVVAKRLFWLQTDALFSSGTTQEIGERFARVISVLNRTPESVLIIEDARDFIDAARANGLGNFINSLNNAVRQGKTQVIFETRDEDLDVVLTAHSDMREGYTLIDLNEPTPDALREIVARCAEGLSRHHGIRVTDEAIDIAIELTSKYRTQDLGLSRAQPERSVTLLDRALSTYRLNAHKQHPDMAALLAELGPAVATPDGAARVAALQAEFATHQAEVRRLYQHQRDGEAAILDLEAEIEERKKEEDARRQAGETAEAPPPGRSIRTLAAHATKGGLESAAVQELREKIRRFQAAVDENRAKFTELTQRINAKLSVTRETVIAQFSSISGLSVSKLTQDERKKLLNLEESMSAKVFGQDNAVRRLANAIKVASVGRRTGGEPMASFLFMGPSGVGKTELAKVLTGIMLDDPAALTRFDMSEYMEKHAVAKLIGAPPGYEGFEAGGILTNAMRKNPRRVLLFDEIEKAHPDVFNIFLQILSDSRLTDNVGRVVSFDDAVIIMTTNIGQGAFLNKDLTEEEANAEAWEELSRTYRPEFLNRFAGRQNIVSFNRLDLATIARIVRREVDRVANKYAGNGLAMAMEDTAIATFCADHYDPATGARGLPGYIKANLEPTLADLLLENPDFKGTILVGYDKDAQEFTVSIEATPAEEHSGVDARSAA